MKMVPMGKYKGQPVEVMAEDKPYVEWISSQAWFRDKFASLHQMLSQSQVSNDTPEHNAMQAKFIDWHYALAATFALMRRDWMGEHDCIAIEKTNNKAVEIAKKNSGLDFLFRDVVVCVTAPYLSHAEFEVRSADVFLEGDRFSSSFEGGYYKYQEVSKMLDEAGFISGYGKFQLRIELKPSLGDDYPSVLRQCIAAKCDSIVVGSYSGSGAPFESVIEIFKRSGIRMISEPEITDWLPIAKKYHEKTS